MVIHPNVVKSANMSEDWEGLPRNSVSTSVAASAANLPMGGRFKMGWGVEDICEHATVCCLTIVVWAWLFLSAALLLFCEEFTETEEEAQGQQKITTQGCLVWSAHSVMLSLHQRSLWGTGTRSDLCLSSVLKSAKKDLYKAPVCTKVSKWKGFSQRAQRFKKKSRGWVVTAGLPLVLLEEEWSSQAKLHKSVKRRISLQNWKCICSFGADDIATAVCARFPLKLQI